MAVIMMAMIVAVAFTTAEANDIVATIEKVISTAD